MVRRQRRRIRRRNRPRGLIPYECTFTYTLNSARIVYVTSADLGLDPSRPLALKSFSVSAATQSPTAVQISYANGLEVVTLPALVIGTNRCFYRGRMPIMLPRIYDTSINIFTVNFTASLDSRVEMTFRVMARPFGVSNKSFGSIVNAKGDIVSPLDVQPSAPSSVASAFDKIDL